MTEDNREMANWMETVCESVAWLTALPRRFNGTKMCPLKFRDALWIGYGKKPLDLEITLDRCGKPFDVAHAMSCKEGGLVSLRHEAAKLEWTVLLRLAY